MIQVASLACHARCPSSSSRSLWNLRRGAWLGASLGLCLSFVRVFVRSQSRGLRSKERPPIRSNRGLDSRSRKTGERPRTPFKGKGPSAIRCERGLACVDGRSRYFFMGKRLSCCQAKNAFIFDPQPGSVNNNAYYFGPPFTESVSAEDTGRPVTRCTHSRQIGKPTRAA